MGCWSLTAGDAPKGRLRVCAQNMQNYYINYDNYESSRANYNAAAFAQKTQRIVDAFLLMNADIYALCEVEACSEVLKQLADSLNKRAGMRRYAAVSDGIYEAWDARYDNNLKSGFIYRRDRVSPYQSNIAATTATYYKNTMRIQAFEERSSGERLVVSMNHFKAKTSSDSESKQQTNAENLIKALKKSLGDPDILILGDLNCETGDAPIEYIRKAGYSEQLLRFDPNAYSHCYGGVGNLIDHALANQSMSEQIVYTQVYHICTIYCGDGNNRSTSYSDHDPYVVDINLGEYVPWTEDVDRIQESGFRIQKILRDGQIYIVRGEKVFTLTGQVVQ